MTVCSNPQNTVQAIRQKCLDCAENYAEVTRCEFTDCSLYPYRFGKNPFRGKEKPQSYKPPLKAIRAECLSCNGSSEEVKLCPVTDCALWPYRLGKDPFVSEAKRAASQKNRKFLKKRVYTGEIIAKG